MFSFLKQDLKIFSFFDLELKLKILALFLSLKDNTKYMYILNQHWIGKHPMQYCPNRLIYINALSLSFSLKSYFFHALLQKEEFRPQTSF